MNQSIKLLVALLVLTNSAISSAQELHTFSNGEVADADKINENFNYVLERASGGCSAKQEGSNVVITCPDGSQGVLASEGTVVTYPSGGFVGELNPETIPSGDIVLIDANDVILSNTSASATGETLFYVLSEGRQVSATIVNLTSEQRVILTSWGASYLYFVSTDCSGQPLAANSILHEISGKYFVPKASYQRQETLVNSRIQSGNGTYPEYYKASSQCEQKTTIANAYLMVEYTPAPEILNAAYPVRLEQLP